MIFLTVGLQYLHRDLYQVPYLNLECICSK